ncbi:MAG TPA: RES domain-containing protein [Pyrinomonadaceae bacterium]|nr:RES domain-containing protein [Pyrinomonadaceae bacterium]
MTTPFDQLSRVLIVGQRTPLKQRLQEEANATAFIDDHNTWVESLSDDNPMKEKLRATRTINLQARGEGEHPLSDISADAIRQQIGDLEVLKSPTADSSVISEKVAALLDGYTLLTKCLRLKVIFRARRNSSRSEFTNITELWYPKPEYVTTIGRANKISSPMFYCAQDFDIALTELHPKVGETITVLESEVIDPEHFPRTAQVGVTELTSKHIRAFAYTLDEHMTLSGHLIRPGYSEKNALLHGYSLREFTQVVKDGAEYLYNITAQISEAILREHGVEGLCYPSIAAEYRGVNLALEPKTVDDTYRPVGCLELHIEQLAPLRYKLLRRARSIERSGEIIWDGAVARSLA